MNKQKKRILFVCMGNICRSPTAEGVMRRLADEGGGASFPIEIDSAGTHGYHIGSPPDSRAAAAAANRGYDLSPIRSRRVEESDFADFDLILAMDADNLAFLKAAAPPNCNAEIRLFLEFTEHSEMHSAARRAEIPDPYFGGEGGFDFVLDLIENAARGLLKKIRGENPN